MKKMILALGAGFTGLCLICLLLWRGLSVKTEWEPEDVITEDEILIWLEEDMWQINGENSIGIGIPQTQEMFCIPLSDESDRGIKLQQLQSGKLKVSGRLDMGRGYFEGNVSWNGQEICVVNFATMEYMFLKENLNSFTLGDYYVSCRYVEGSDEMGILVFYCPAS